ncbi:MAG TPA: hypothetical protein VFJ74_17040 [Gemmatimonadaceae bacterium]|nr:hypothetical protein [Gemmatimonadaceae bacterium]
MPQDFVVWRRDLPGGRTVMITIDEREPTAVVGRLMLERRTDAERRRAGEPPIVAEVSGGSRNEVLASLRALAESEGEVARRLESWLTSRRSAEQVLPPGQRVRMLDGTWWSVERRHEDPRLDRATPPSSTSRLGARPRERALYLWFHGGDGALRQTEVAPDFPDQVSTAELQELWSRATVVR